MHEKVKRCSRCKSCYSFQCYVGAYFDDDKLDFALTQTNKQSKQTNKQNKESAEVIHFKIHFRIFDKKDFRI